MDELREPSATSLSACAVFFFFYGVTAGLLTMDELREPSAKRLKVEPTSEDGKT